MTDSSTPLRKSGTLVRDAGGFALRCDDGNLIRLVLHRVPVDLVEKRVMVTGTVAGENLLEAEGVAPASD